MTKYIVKVGAYYISKLKPNSITFDGRKKKALLLDNHYCQAWNLAHMFHGELIKIKSIDKKEGEKNMRYTELELKIIKSIGSFLNYDDLESNLDDNATYFTMSDIDIESKILRGVLSNLEQIGLIFKDYVGESMFAVTNSGVIFAVTNFGVKEYYRIYR